MFQQSADADKHYQQQSKAMRNIKKIMSRHYDQMSMTINRAYEMSEVDKPSELLLPINTRVCLAVSN